MRSIKLSNLLHLLRPTYLVALAMALKITGLGLENGGLKPIPDCYCCCCRN